MVTVTFLQQKPNDAPIHYNFTFLYIFPLNFLFGWHFFAVFRMNILTGYRFTATTRYALNC